MPQTTIARGNELYDWLCGVTVTWSGSVGATSTAELTCTVPGLLVGDYVDMYLSTQALTTGLSITNMRVSAANTMAVTVVNATAGALTPPVGPWTLNVVRPENPNNLPASAA